MLGQHARPCCMKQNRWRRAPGRGSATDQRDDVVLEAQDRLADRGAVMAHVDDTADCGGFIDAAQAFAEIRLVHAVVDSASAGDKVAIGRRRRQCRRIGEQQVAHLIQDHSHGHRIRHDVVPQHGQDQTVVAGIGMTPQLQQRRGAQVHAYGAWNAVEHGQRHLAQHDLHRPFQCLPEQGSAQHVVACDHRLQRVDEALHAHDAIEFQTYPQDVGIGRVLGVQQMMKQDAILQWRKRIDILHIGRAARDRVDNAVDRSLRQRYQRQQVRGDRGTTRLDQVRWHWLRSPARYLCGEIGQYRR
ncbi:hypothetical protein LMG19145_03989 [Xanthomonas arboricola pv. fragariae]|nr:hypothetical protein LMG19145_03989 [Xanthomonas arboricola pv. fragariae]